MVKNNPGFVVMKTPDWLTIQEATEHIRLSANSRLTASDIYRHALYGNICLSVYFQSPVILRKVIQVKNKIRLRQSGASLVQRLCYTDSSGFINKTNFVVHTEGKYRFYPCQVIDTSLAGCERASVQRLLAHSLKIPAPAKQCHCFNYGVSVSLCGEMFQLFERITWQERISKQIMKLPMPVSQKIREQISRLDLCELYHREYFPLYDMPADACFVIRHPELKKLMSTGIPDKKLPPVSARISTPLSRLLWLSCKNNEAISPLLNKPYKLINIFQQWASACGLTGHFCGDTLKNALERGSPDGHLKYNKVKRPCKEQ